MQLTYRQRRGFKEQEVGRERMLLDDASNRVHVLNGSATFIWDFIREPATLDGIEQGLRGRYDMSTVTDVPKVIRSILADLEARNLVETGTTECPAGAAEPGRAVAAHKESEEA
jgi:hypothetical protein